MAHMIHQHKQPLRPTLRDTVGLNDRDAVQRIVAATGFFRPDEIDVAVELVDTRITNGEASGYYFIFAETAGTVVGYACYGPIACAVGSYDLYWIVVDPALQGMSIGRMLLAEVEHRIECLRGRHIYIETSGRPQYAPTRKFYERCGYQLAAVLNDFYDRGDDKVIWRKEV
jgi:ribosomal protein S18 acetylase RimI-like enzyme